MSPGIFAFARMDDDDMEKRAANTHTHGAVQTLEWTDSD